MAIFRITLDLLANLEAKKAQNGILQALTIANCQAKLLCPVSYLLTFQDKHTLDDKEAGTAEITQTLFTVEGEGQV